MFKPDLADPQTGRSRYLPDSTGWDIEEGADVVDVFQELQAMTGLPVDVAINRRYGTKARFEFRAVVKFVDDTIDVHGSPNRGVRVEAAGVDPIVLSESDFVCAKLSPGCVKATFRHLEVKVSRVSLTWWRVAS